MVSSPDAAAHHGRDDSRQLAKLYGLFVAGSMMFENPTVRDTIRIASAAVPGISTCTVAAVYIAHEGCLRHHSGETDAVVDEAVLATDPRDGLIIAEDGSWRYAVYLEANAATHGCLVLRPVSRSGAKPSPAERFLLHALARSTGAALATAGILEKERRNSRALRKLGEAQAGTNHAMADTIRQLNAHQRIRDTFTEASAAGGGEMAVIETLSALIDRPIVLQGPFGETRVLVGPQPAPSSALIPDERLEPSDRLSSEWRASVIRSKDELFGLIGIFDPGSTLTEEDRFTIDYALNFLIVELVHRRRIAETELALGRDLADDLVSGTDIDGSWIRAEALRYDLSQPQRVVIASWRHSATTGIPLDTALRREFGKMHTPTLISRRPDAVVAVIADTDDFTRLHERLSAALGSHQGSIGIGGRCTADDLPTSFAQARRALHIRQESRQPDGLSNHDDLGLFQILDSSDGGTGVKTYVQEWLGALLSYDRIHHSDLVHTLGVHLDTGGSYDDTATALIVHRSTVRYRLNRIRELTGRNLSDPDTRFNLHVATRAWAATLGTSD
jgi:hypothetical protein